MGTKRIIIDSNIFDGLNGSIHEENLRIAELNIKDYCDRTSRDITLNYDNFKFSLAICEIKVDIAEKINLYISWFRNKEHDYNIYKQTLLSWIKSEYDNITQDIRARQKVSKINLRDIEIFNSSRDEFVLKYINFHPIGILSEDQEIELKSFINNEYISPILEE